MIVHLLRTVERRQMLFIGVTASLFTLGPLLAPDVLRPGNAAVEIPGYVQRMKASELADREAARNGIIRCGNDPAWSMIAIINSPELNRRVTPLKARLRVRAQIGEVPGQVVISGQGGSLRENWTVANRAAAEYVRISREAEHSARRQTRQYLLLVLKRSEQWLQSAGRAAQSTTRAPRDAKRKTRRTTVAEIHRVKADIARYREVMASFSKDISPPNKLRIIAWAGYRSRFIGPWIVVAWGLLCAGLGAGAALIIDRRAMEFEEAASCHALR